MSFVSLDQLTHKLTKPIVFTHRDVMEFVDSDQSIVKGFDAEPFKCKTESCVSTDQYSIIRREEFAECIDFATVRTRCVAKVPLRRDIPIREEAILR